MQEEKRCTTSVTFSEPETEIEAERYKQAQAEVRAALEKLLEAATDAGWGSQEIVVAIVEGGTFLKQAHIAAPTGEAL
ncbi:hypothetical protein [Rhizobium sp.]|uniref:hypothetical protein n=1 Tax=Rhizobium sp. TaxID=391 RepID=UPI000DD6B4C8